MWLSSCNSGLLEYTKHCGHVLPPQLHSPHRTHLTRCSNHAICEKFQNLWRIGHAKPTPITERTLNVSLDPFSHGGALKKPCLRRRRFFYVASARLSFLTLRARRKQLLDCFLEYQFVQFHELLDVSGCQLFAHATLANQRLKIFINPSM